MKKIGIVTLTIAVIIGFYSSVYATIILDQVQDIDDPNWGMNWSILYPQMSVGQSFVSGCTGLLDHIDIYAGADRQKDLLINVYSTGLDGLPSDLLGNVNVTFDFPTQQSFYYDWFTINLSNEDIRIVEGEQYAFEIGQINHYGNVMQLNLGQPHRYTDGSMFISSNGVFSDANADMMFKTYMQPVPEPATLLLLGLSIIGLAKRKLRK